MSQNSKFDIQVISTLEHFERASLLRNLSFTHGPISGQEMLHHTELFPKDKKMRKLIVQKDGVDFAYLSILEAYWADEADLISWNLSFDPAQITRQEYFALYEICLANSLELGAKKLNHWAESTQVIAVQCLRELGYVEGQKNPCTRLDVEAFDLQKWKDSVQLPAGFYLMTGDEVKEAHPDTWKHMFWRFEMDSLADVPLPSPFIETTFEKFEEEISGPYAHLMHRVFAMDGNKIASGSQIERYAANPSLGHIAISGTMREHRRKGLARILKILSIESAKEAGIKFIYTDNEQSNPLLKVNFELGYEHISDFMNFTKEVI